MKTLLIGGSPCQGFSRNGKMLKLDDPRSKLFFDFHKAYVTLNPDFFLLENVDMDKESEAVITEMMGVKPIKINSGLLGAQKRRRTYWTNIPVDPIVDTEETLDQYIFSSELLCKHHYDLTFDEQWMMRETANGYLVRNNTKYKGYLRAKMYDGIDFSMPKSKYRRGSVQKSKIGTLDTSCNWGVIDDSGRPRKLLIEECESLQGLPMTYTYGFSDSARKKMIGNGWHIPTIAHIFKNLPDHIDVVVSGFDGISCGQLALEMAKKTYDNYYAFEIDEKPIQVAQNNYPNTIQMGDITTVNWQAFKEQYLKGETPC